jgi:hypothetical protein
MKISPIPPKKFLMGNSTTHGQYKYQEQDRSTFSRGMKCRFWEYEDGGASSGYRRMEALFEGGQSQEEAVAQYIDR